MMHFLYALLMFVASLARIVMKIVFYINALLSHCGINIFNNIDQYDLRTFSKFHIGVKCQCENKFLSFQNVYALEECND